MPITMQSYALTWTDANGVRRASGVSYDKPSAEHRKAELEAAGASDVKVIPIRPGELPQPRTWAAAKPPVGSREGRQAPPATGGAGRA